jgi:ribose/xylose/arabinose/galactoside ABC-type transport system permease subunit
MDASRVPTGAGTGPPAGPDAVGDASAAREPTAIVAPRLSYGTRLRRWLQRYGAIVALAVLVAAAGALVPNFLTEGNIHSQLQIFALETALVSVGQTLVILTGGVDLSVGSLLAVGSCAAGQLVLVGAPFPLVFAAPMLLTTLLGAISGTVIAKARIQPIVVTLAMLIAARGLAQLITGGGGQGHTLDLSNNLDFGNLAITQLGPVPVLGPIPISVVLVLAVYTLVAFFLSRTAAGRYVYAVGGNERAVRLSGVAADRVKILVYAISGLLAGLAGVLFASHNQTSDPFNDGVYFELTTIAAVVVGGTSLLGGVGGVWRTLVGGLILVVLYALLVQYGLSQPAQLIVRGLIIAGAVILQGGGES